MLSINIYTKKVFIRYIRSILKNTLKTFTKYIKNTFNSILKVYSYVSKKHKYCIYKNTYKEYI